LPKAHLAIRLPLIRLARVKPLKNLPPNYVPTITIDLTNWRLALAMNLAGLTMLIFFGWAFLQAAVTLRPEASTLSAASILGSSGLLNIALALVTVLLLHELIHGFCFWIFTGERPKFGLHPLYAYAAAPDWYLPRNSFMVVGIAPFVAITVVGLILLPVVPFSTLPFLLVSLTFNAAGSTGDLIVVSWLITQPAVILARDVGPKISIFEPTSPKVDTLNQRWISLMQSFGVGQEAARLAYANLVNHYSEDGRHYHTLTHVKTLLNVADGLRSLAQDFRAVELSIWFHDVIYDPRANDNEERSSDYARRALQELGLPSKIVDRVSELILATITHKPVPGDNDVPIVIDADLSPLGADAASFRRDSQAIRKEFYWIADEEYRANRVERLGEFLKRERIYLTEQMYASLEASARRNISREIRSLSAAE
jgi:predicted metal-dependent HD superfamily phosphohydrolase